MFICHHCDNPPCVRPDHLFLGTHADNMQDCALKGRAGPHDGVLKGSGHYKAVLSESDVIDIRTLAAFGASRNTLARAFGVTKANVNHIVWRNSWTHVP